MENQNDILMRLQAEVVVMQQALKVLFEQHPSIDHKPAKMVVYENVERLAIQLRKQGESQFADALHKANKL